MHSLRCRWRPASSSPHWHASPGFCNTRLSPHSSTLLPTLWTVSHGLCVTCINNKGSTPEYDTCHSRKKKKKPALWSCGELEQRRGADSGSLLCSERHLFLLRKNQWMLKLLRLWRLIKFWDINQQHWEGYNQCFFEFERQRLPSCFPIPSSHYMRIISMLIPCVSFAAVSLLFCRNVCSKRRSLASIASVGSLEQSLKSGES